MSSGSGERRRRLGGRAAPTYAEVSPPAVEHLAHLWSAPNARGGAGKRVQRDDLTMSAGREGRLLAEYRSHVYP
jgi:hypothetical protein